MWLGYLQQTMFRQSSRRTSQRCDQVIYSRLCLGSLLEELARDVARLSIVDYVQVVYQKNQLEIWLGYLQYNMFRQSSKRTSQRCGQVIYSIKCLGSLLEELARDMGRLTHLQCVKCQSIFSQELEAGRQRKNKLEVKSQKKMQLW